MHTSLFLPISILIAAALAFAILSAAEAVATDLVRLRVRSDPHANLEGLLRAYVSERRRVLRALRLAITAVTVIAAVAAVAETGAGMALAATAGALVFVGIAALRVSARLVARTRPGRAARVLDAPLRLVQIAIVPLLAITAPVAAALRALGHTGSGEDPDPAEELIQLLEATDGTDEALTEERRMIRGVLQLSGQTVRELMTPRSDITAISSDMTFREVVRVILDSGYSRVPVYEETLDRIVGVIYAKDLLPSLGADPAPADWHPLIRSVGFVPEAKRLDRQLRDFQRSASHLVVVVDEFGGTSGIVTLEDVLEQIVGEIRDEYDTDEVAPVQPLPEGGWVVQGGVPLADLEAQLGHAFAREDVSTVGGLVLTLFGRVPRPGETLLLDGFRLTVDQVVRRRIRRVTLAPVSLARPTPAVSAAPPASPASPLPPP